MKTILTIREIERLLVMRAHRLAPETYELFPEDLLSFIYETTEENDEEALFSAVGHA